MEIVKDDFVISTKKEKLDIESIHDFLSNESYWSKGIPIEIVQKSIENSLNFGLYYNEKQIGFARVISDYTTIAYLGDVYILKDYRGKGLSKWLMQTIMTHPELQTIRRWILLTKTAHSLYEKYGFKNLTNAERYMEKHNPEIYLS